jgi:membrane-associated protein
MFDVDSLLTTFGLVGVLAVIFMETGILIGFIFPGDTLLFTAGIMSASADRAIAPLWVLMVLIPVAAALGDQLGYLIGRRYGPPALQSRVLNWIGPRSRGEDRGLLRPLRTGDRDVRPVHRRGPYRHPRWSPASRR